MIGKSKVVSSIFLDEDKRNKAQELANQYIPDKLGCYIHLSEYFWQNHV